MSAEETDVATSAVVGPASSTSPRPSSSPSPAGPQYVPTSGATLYGLEVRRLRERLLPTTTTTKQGGGWGNGDRLRMRTGCAEIDGGALLGGGFERGTIVGVSAEEADFGVLVGLQTVARALVSDHSGEGIGGGKPESTGANRLRAAVVTTLPPAAILPLLRDVVAAQARARFATGHRPRGTEEVEEVVKGIVRSCLERVSISRIFDIEGLWEVIRELETPISTTPDARTEGAQIASPSGKDGGADPIRSTTAQEEEAQAVFPESLVSEPSPSKVSGNDEDSDADLGLVVADPPVPELPPRTHKTEIQDSEDDEDGGLDSSPPPMIASPRAKLPITLPSLRSPRSPLLRPPPSQLPPAAPPTTSTPREPAGGVREDNAEKAAGDEERSGREAGAEKGENEPTPTLPDIILVTHFSSLLAGLFARAGDHGKAAAHATLQLLAAHLRHLCRAPAPPLVMLLNTTTATATTAAAAAAPAPAPTLRSVFSAAPAPARPRSKPAFGATFAQLLDLHLLCTRVPRSPADARRCWVVEVLLDELGVWERATEASGGGGEEGRNAGGSGGDGGTGGRWQRRSREQRWGAVDVRAGVTIVDAFPGPGS
ncbi:hypothetical protein GGS23DRAFT_613261 [Durotheca rogersii]|uniref:uncharacterized protein n=1 Tax=Durotheca rogersii TaxID=419775 RepID=UPI002220DBA9|nr:uncharacterized protein GGS23DRAFT_613261 [Durotheca rogersii]KAI5861088.1 hypothetical protein GGS23DRAFT_613261 [Durotheca rogersii]